MSERSAPGRRANNAAAACSHRSPVPGFGGPGNEEGAEEDRFRFDLFIRLHHGERGKGQHNKKARLLRAGLWITEPNLLRS